MKGKRERKKTDPKDSMTAVKKGEGLSEVMSTRSSCQAESGPEKKQEKEREILIQNVKSSIDLIKKGREPHLFFSFLKVE